MQLQNDRLNVRIKRIEFKNFRNIESGAVDFPNADVNDFYAGKPSVLGLYGPNGSGKSSVIMALSVLKEVLSGRKISDKYSSCIHVGCDNCTLSFTFSIFGKLVNENNINIENSNIPECNEIFYDFDIKKCAKKVINDVGVQEETTVYIVENEVLKIRTLDSLGTVIKSKNTLFDTRKSASDDKGMLFGTKTLYYVILTEGDNKEVLDEYKEAKVISKENGTSFLFSNKFTEIPLNKYNDPKYSQIFEDLEERFSFSTLIQKYIEGKISNNEIERFETRFNNYAGDNAEDYTFAMLKSICLMPIVILKYYGRNYLQIIDTKATGITNINMRLPLLLWKRNNGNNDDIFVYKCYLLMDQPTAVPEEYFSDTKKALSAISDVLNKIAPDMTIDIADLGKRYTKDNREEHCFEILSRRDNYTMPLKFESDGTRRLISVLGMLIAAYNEESFTVAIDEIDSGIFEYILGILLSVMSESIKGQFIFTSHNLRPLEVLSTKYLCFTTTDPKDRFSTLPHRGNSNMRDTYIKKIARKSKEDEEKLKTEMKNALYKAGHL